MFLQLTEQELIEHMNVARNVIINTLWHEGLISRENATKFVNEYAVILGKPSWLRKLFLKLEKEGPAYDSRDYPVICVKAILHFGEEKNDNERDDSETRADPPSGTQEPSDLPSSSPETEEQESK